MPFNYKTRSGENKYFLPNEELTVRVTGCLGNSSEPAKIISNKFGCTLYRENSAPVHYQPNQKIRTSQGTIEVR